MRRAKFRTGQVIRLRDEPDRFLKIKQVRESGFENSGQQWSYDFYGTNNWNKLESELRRLTVKEKG